MAKHKVHRISPKGPSKATRQPSATTAKGAKASVPGKTVTAGKSNVASPTNGGKPA